MELLSILLATVLVNNFVLVNFLGLCPFVGASRQFDSALSMGMATAFVLTLSSVLSSLIYNALLLPLALEYLKTISFILVIAVTVQGTEIYLRASQPLLHKMMGIYLPLITSNCAVLGVALLNVQQQHTLLESAVYGFGAAAGFTLVMILFASIREYLQTSDIPKPFTGVPIALVSAGLMSLAFMGFAGMGR